MPPKYGALEPGPDRADRADPVSGKRWWVVVLTLVGALATTGYAGYRHTTGIAEGVGAAEDFQADMLSRVAVHGATAPAAGVASGGDDSTDMSSGGFGGQADGGGPRRMGEAASAPLKNGSGPPARAPPTRAAYLCMPPRVPYVCDHCSPPHTSDVRTVLAQPPRRTDNGMAEFGAREAGPAREDGGGNVWVNLTALKYRYGCASRHTAARR